jgi:hypothetical protein
MIPRSEVTLRSALPEDAPTIAEIWHLGWRDGHLGFVSQQLIEACHEHTFRAIAAKQVNVDQRHRNWWQQGQEAEAPVGVNQVSRYGIARGYEEKTRARLGGLEPPRSHERSLALWDRASGYRSENSWLRVCVILATTTKYPSEYAKPAGARGLASLEPGLCAIQPMAASSAFASG